MYKLHGALLNQKTYDDEYYTLYEEVKEIFERYIPIEELKDKIIYCPCDSDESNFVIYLKEHKDDIQYKELIYTSDDFNTHLDLFEKCDIIITNPPFSKIIKEFIPILKKVNKKFFIFGSIASMIKFFYKFDEDIKFQRHYPYYSFKRPDGSYNLVPYVYIYNLENVPINFKEKTLIFRKPKDPIKAVNNLGEEYYNFDYIFNIQRDFKYKFLAPSTILFEPSRQYINVFKDNLGSLTFEDNKNRFVRILCKIKDDKL